MTRGSIEKMKEYVTRTGVSYPANSKYQLVWNEICALRQLAEELPCAAIFLAFNYGRAMGERHARERKEAATRG